MRPDDFDLEACLDVLREQNANKRIKRFPYSDGFYEAKVIGSDVDFYDEDFHNFIILEIKGSRYAFDFNEYDKKALKWISHLSSTKDDSLHFNYYLDRDYGEAVGYTVVIKIITDYQRPNRAQLSNRVIDFNFLPKSLYDFYGY